MEDYKKYKWFFTSSNKLVIGGKSAEQNDQLLKKIKESNKDYYVMHTSEPGSPFSVIIADLDDVNDKDLKECAIFTGCFSRAWKLGKKKAKVDLFLSKDIIKSRNMKTGTWGVLKRLKSFDIELKLALTKQKSIIRAVPESAAKPALLRIMPGKINKKDMLVKIQIELGEEINASDLDAALPAGGVGIVKK